MSRALSEAEPIVATAFHENLKLPSHALHQLAQVVEAIAGYSELNEDVGRAIDQLREAVGRELPPLSQMQDQLESFMHDAAVTMCEDKLLHEMSVTKDFS
jgi:hypothetical protein